MSLFALLNEENLTTIYTKHLIMGLDLSLIFISIYFNAMISESIHSPSLRISCQVI